MDEQRQDNHLEPIYNSSVPIQDVALKAYREQWTIGTGGGRGSGRSLLAARLDDDDDDDDSKYFMVTLQHFDNITLKQSDDNTKQNGKHCLFLE